MSQSPNTTSKTSWIGRIKDKIASRKKSEFELPDATKSVLKKVREIEIRVNRLVSETLAGEYKSVFKGRGMDFDEVREYVPGDEVRLIDWNVTARTAAQGKAYVKKFREERELTILVAVDISASGNFGSMTQSKRDLAAEVACVLAFSAIKNRDRVGLVLFSDQIEHYLPAKKGRQHVLRVVRDILSYRPRHRGTDIASALNFINLVTHKKAIVFLVSDFQTNLSTSPGEPEVIGSKLKASFEITARKHDLVGIRIHDPYEKQLPDAGVMTIEDAETGEMLEVNTGNSRLREMFSTFALDDEKRLLSLLRSTGVDILNIETGKAYLPALIQFFKSRESRR